MAADYTRTIVFKVEDQAIKRATGQIVASLKKIEKTLEKIEKKAFTQLVTDSGKVADNIDRATRALNKYNSELRKAQTQGKLSPFKSALAVREPGGALARTGGGAKRGRVPWGAIRGFGNLAGVGAAGITASTLAINSLTKQANNFTATLRQVPVVGDAIANKFNLVEHKVNGLSISLHALGQLMHAHPFLSAATAALIFGVGANVKNVTTAVWGLQNALKATGKGMSTLLRTAKNTSRGIKESLVGTFAGVSGSYGGPVDKGFVSGKGYGLGLRQFLKPAKDATVDVFDIGKSSPYADYYSEIAGVKSTSYRKKYSGLPYVDREAAEAKRFTDIMRARGLDPRQKRGINARIRSNVEASRISRAGSGFGEWTAHINGSKRANKLLTDKQKILKAISRQNAKLKAQGKEEIQIADVLNKKARERLGITEKEGEWSYGDRRRNLMSREARRERRDRARQRLDRRKQDKFSQRLPGKFKGMGGKQAENLMLGFGFPMLFGGGVGAVGGGLGGALLGNLLGLPGFGLQISGSAIGTQLEQLHSRVVSIGNATRTLNLDKLEESGIRVNAQLELQVERLKKVGKFAEAEQLLESKVSQTTGAVGTTNKDIANNVAMLTNVWDSLLAAVGTTLGIIAAPFVTALAAILKLVQLLVVGVNVILSSVTWLLKQTVSLIDRLPGGKWLLEQIEKAMNNMNGALDEMAVKWGKWTDKMREEREAILEKISLGEKEASIQADIRDAVAAQGNEHRNQIEFTVRLLHATRDHYDEVKKVRDAYKAIGTTIKDGIVDSLEAAISKTKSLGDVARDVFRSITSQLLKMGVNSALTGMFGGTGFGKFLGVGSSQQQKFANIRELLGEENINRLYIDPVEDAELFRALYSEQKARGGPVTGGSPYIVGEKGPELFVPNSHGSIVPNHDLGGGANIVVNVDASGSSVEGDTGQAEELGTMLASAVQAEILNQQRPGGLLAGTR